MLGDENSFVGAANSSVAGDISFLCDNRLCSFLDVRESPWETGEAWSWGEIGSESEDCAWSGRDTGDCGSCLLTSCDYNKLM